MLKLDCAFTTNVGRIRKNNEDNFYLNGSFKRAPEDTEYKKKDFLYDGGLFAVCDGMGGEEFGEKASLYAVEILKDYQGEDFEKYADEYIEKANERICQMIDENNGSRSGSTLAILYIKEGRAVCYNVGDSRVYLFRNNRIIQISEDHTVAARMVKMGVLTEEQAAVHKDKHVLTQHLGIFPNELVIEAYKSEAVNLCHDDIIIMCSDGLTDMLSDKDIERVLKGKGTSKEFSEILENLALEKGGKDNITVGVIKAVYKKPRLWDRIWRKK